MSKRVNYCPSRNFAPKSSVWVSILGKMLKATNFLGYDNIWSIFKFINRFSREVLLENDRFRLFYEYEIKKAFLDRCF